MGKVFRETFDEPRRGWLSYSGTEAVAAQVEGGAAVTRSPWWVDYNHAPPGAGYLHILFGLHTHHWPGWAAAQDPVFGPNPFVEQGCPTDFRNARVTCRIKGDLCTRGASVVFLAQGKVRSTGKWVNQVLTAQPIEVRPQWAEQTVALTPDQAQWTQLGSRHDRQDTYGEGPIEELLADLNGDLLLVLFPLDIAPVPPIGGDIHRLRAGVDPSEGGFAIDRARLPEGEVRLDTFEVEFAG